jgi:hypothetical protein
LAVSKSFLTGFLSIIAICHFFKNRNASCSTSLLTRFCILILILL